MTLPLKMARKITFRQGDRLFEAINDLTILLAALGVAMQAVSKSGRTPDQAGVMRMKPRHFDWALAFPLRGPLQIALMGKLPVSIDVGLIDAEEAMKEITDQGKHETSGFGSVIHHIAKTIYLGYFERYNSWLSDNVGDSTIWPETLNFARVVRNAIAHGSINIRNPSAPPARWKTLSYSYADSGRDILGEDIGPADLIGLMIETQTDLDGLRAPIL